MRTIRSLPILLVALVLAACGDDGPTEPRFPDFTGTYVYSGTMNGFPHVDLTGTLAIQSQQGGTAKTIPTVHFRADGETYFTVFTQVPGDATLGQDGAISFRTEGQGWTMQHDGNLSGNRISGTWTVVGNDGSSASGSFSAQR